MRVRRMAAVLGLATSLAAGGAGPVPDEPSPDWRAGPVRYILTVQEDADYHALKTDDQRRSFIEEFWKALDPTPETSPNERRDEFWKRVADAAQYREELPGWRTDRGKAHILMGPPDRRLLQGSTETWVYDALPRPDAPPEVRVLFTRMSSGDFRMRAGDLLYMDPNAESAGVPVGDTFLAAPGTGSSPRMLKQRIRMLDFAEARSDYFVETLDFRWRLYFSRGEDDTTRTAFVVSVPLAQFEGTDSATPGPDVSVTATFTDAAGKRPARRLAGALHALDGGAGPSARARIFQATWSLPPGRYDATLLVADRRSRRGATAQGKVDVPDFHRDLALNTIALGRLHAAGDTMSSVPDPTATFARGERMAIACSIYNARRRDGRVSLGLEYSFLLRRGEETLLVGRPVVQTGLSSESQAFEVTLQGWPAGSYVVRVKATDGVTRKSAQGEAEFQVVETAPDR